MLLTQLLGYAPTFLVYLVGIAVALAMLQRSPRPATFVLLGCTVMLLGTIMSIGLQHWVMRSHSASLVPSSIARSMSIVGILSTLIHSVGIGLLIAAAFTGRTTSSTARPGT